MQHRTVGIVAVAGIAAVLIGGVAGAAVMPLAPDDPGAGVIAGEPAGHAFSGSIVLDGETFVTYEGIVTSDGTAYLRARSDDGFVRELYQEDGIVYARLETTGTDQVEELGRTFGADIVRQRDEDGRLTTFLRADEPDRRVEASVTDWNEVVVDNLQLTAYEQVDDGRYEPRNGWFATGREYRVTGASGEVRVDPGSGAVTEADVAFRRTFAGSYLAYYFGDSDSVDTEISYERRPAPAAVDPPEWVETVRAGAE